MSYFNQYNSGNSFNGIYNNKGIILPDEIIEKAESGYTPEICDGKLRYLYHKLRPTLSFYEPQSPDFKERTYILKGLHVDDLRAAYVSAILTHFVREHEFMLYRRSCEIPCPEEINNKSHQYYPTGEFLCLHKFRKHWDNDNDSELFSASIASILAQAPEELIEISNCFEIRDYPSSLEEAELYPEVHNKGYHISRVRTYMNYKDKTK